MKGGTRRPVPAIKSRLSGRRKARLWPEEAPDDDRITNQVCNIRFFKSIKYKTKKYDNNFANL